MDTESESALGALLVASDHVIIEQVSRSLNQLAAATEVAKDLQTALRLLSTRKFEAVIVDLQLGESGVTVLERLRLAPSNRTTVVFAISGSPEESKRAFEAGSNFILDRPVDSESAIRTFKAAYGLMVRERRRYFRCPLQTLASLCADGEEEIPCQTTNISEGGMALANVHSLKPGTKVSARFRLPHNELEFALESEVCWYDPRGRIGLQFSCPPEETSLRLKEWLARRVEERLPEAIAFQFRNATPHAD
jgi:CheY-like chemotaxis protein